MFFLSSVKQKGILYYKFKVQKSKFIENTTMKYIVTHSSPDLDAITPIWLLKKFWPEWKDAEIKFVPSGERLENSQSGRQNVESPREQIDGNEVIHVDTGFGFFDHHSTSDESISAASLVWDYLKVQSQEFINKDSEKVKYKMEAIERMVKVIVEIDHFKEVGWENPLAFYHDFSLSGILDGLKLEKPNQDNYYVDFICDCLNAILHTFENRVWAEREIAEKGNEFKTKWGKGLGIETINDSVIKLAQKMGFAVVIRRDPRKGYVRIKANPIAEKQVDLTLAYEKLRKMDPEATWYLHVSNKMLLNGTTKNPKMKPTTLSLNEIIQALEEKA